jgi:hypothetical protein
MSEKDKAKYVAKHGVRKNFGQSRPRSKAPTFMSTKESKRLVKAARIPRSEWKRPEKPNNEKQRIVL